MKTAHWLEKVEQMIKGMRKKKEAKAMQLYPLQFHHFWFSPILVIFDLLAVISRVPI